MKTPISGSKTTRNKLSSQLNTSSFLITDVYRYLKLE